MNISFILALVESKLSWLSPRLASLHWPKCEGIYLKIKAIPDAESEKSSNDEQIIKDCKSNQQPVESFSELFPLHDDDSDSISLKHNHIISVILDQQDSYLII